MFCDSFCDYLQPPDTSLPEAACLVSFVEAFSMYNKVSFVEKFSMYIKVSFEEAFSMFNKVSFV